MPKGGRRPGAGRKPGSGSKKKSAAILTKAFAEGIMPLELLIREMRRMYAAGDESSLREARMLAQAAAPYCHPRLQAIMAQTTLNAGDTLSELLKAIDGTTTGIGNGADGEPALAPQQPLLLPN
jgi:hypothetical protein